MQKVVTVNLNGNAYQLDENRLRRAACVFSIGPPPSSRTIPTATRSCRTSSRPSPRSVSECSARTRASSRPRRWIWAGIVILVVMFQIVTGPLRAARHVSYDVFGGRHSLFAAWDALVGLGFAALLIWLLTRHMPPVHDFAEFMRNLPAAFQALAMDFRVWVTEWPNHSDATTAPSNSRASAAGAPQRVGHRTGARRHRDELSTRSASWWVCRDRAIVNDVKRVRRLVDRAADPNGDVRYRRFRAR